LLNRKLTTTLAILAAAAGFSAFAATANAATLDTDPVELSSDQPDFTGEVAFNFNNGMMTPELRGVLSVENGRNSCVRVLIEHYNGSDFVDSEEGNPMCVDDDEFDSWTVNRHGVSNAWTDRVVVSIQSQPFADWVTEDSATFVVNTHADDVLITKPGIDLGVVDFAGGAPTAPATMNWRLDDSQVFPELEATLHMTNLAGVCGRVRLRFLSDEDGYLDSEESDPECPPTNAHEDYPVDLDSYNSSLIDEVEVVLQTDTGPNNSWARAGGTTVSIAE
jgi:hypothetical protein